jgi:hypothetical protein
MARVGPQRHRGEKKSCAYSYNIILNNITLVIWVIMKSTNWDTCKCTIFGCSFLLLTCTYKHSPLSHSNIKLGKQFVIKCNTTPPTAMVNWSVMLISVLSGYAVIIAQGCTKSRETIFYRTAPKRLIFVGPQYRICFMPTFWRLEFWSSSWMF